MNKVLVTGASGFLGQAVVQELQKVGQYEIFPVISGRRDIAFPEGIAPLKANLLDGRTVEEMLAAVQPHKLVHLAWGQETSDFRVSNSNIDWQIASLRLLKSFLECGGKTFLFAGSSAEYDDQNGLLQDVSGVAAKSVYGQTKIAFEEVAANVCGRAGIQFISARYFTIFGEGDSHAFGAIPQAIRSLIKNERFVGKAPNAYGDYIHVSDAARATCALLGTDYSGPVNVASGTPRRMKDVFTMIARVMGREHLLAFENIDSPSHLLVADTAILNKTVGFVPELDLEGTIERLVAWRKAEEERQKISS